VRKHHTWQFKQLDASTRDDHAYSDRRQRTNLHTFTQGPFQISSVPWAHHTTYTLWTQPFGAGITEIYICTVHWIGIQIQCSMQTRCFNKTFNLILIKFEKILNCRGQLGLQWMSPSKERANVFERAVVANDIFCFMSPANWTPKANIKRKYMNTDNAQWKEPELTTLISEVGGGTNMQARVLQYKA